MQLPHISVTLDFLCCHDNCCPAPVRGWIPTTPPCSADSYLLENSQGALFLLRGQAQIYILIGRLAVVMATISHCVAVCVDSNVWEIEAWCHFLNVGGAYGGVGTEAEPISCSVKQHSINRNTWCHGNSHRSGDADHPTVCGSLLLRLPGDVLPIMLCRGLDPGVRFPSLLEVFSVTHHIHQLVFNERSDVGVLVLNIRTVTASHASPPCSLFFFSFSSVF